MNFQDTCIQHRKCEIQRLLLKEKFFKNGRFRIICPCGLDQLKKKKRMAVRSTLPLEPAHFDLPLEPAHFDDVFHLQSVSDMSAGNINVLATLSAFSGAASAGMLYM